MKRLLRGVLLVAGVPLLVGVLLGEGMARLFWLAIQAMDRLYSMLEEET